MPLLLLPNIPLNPLHCSAVKSSSSPTVYSPPSAAFITKFMMKQFCVLFLQLSRYQGQTYSQGTEYTSCDSMNTPVKTCSFTPVGFIYKSLMENDDDDDDDGHNDVAQFGQDTTSRQRLAGLPSKQQTKSFLLQ